MGIPTVLTARLVLRPFTMADAGTIHTILGDPQVIRYMPTTDRPPLERVKRLIAGQLRAWVNAGMEGGQWITGRAVGLSAGVVSAICRRRTRPKSPISLVDLAGGKDWRRKRLGGRVSSDLRISVWVISAVWCILIMRPRGVFW